MKQIYYLITLISVFILSSCNLDTFPDNEIIDKDIEEIEMISELLTDGAYARFKTVEEFDNQNYTGNTYVRHYFQMSEFTSDNTCLSGRTSDPLYEASTYKRSSQVRNVRYLWYIMYNIIGTNNSIIESISDDVTDPQILHLKGENLTMRALVYLHLSQLWSRPYSHGRDNMGVVLVTSTEAKEVARSTVGEVYDQIVMDLENAVVLMDKGNKRGNPNDRGYISKETAQGLLSRVYLYRNEYDKVIQVVNDMLKGADPLSKLTPTSRFSNYFANALSEAETLWAIAHSPSDSKGSSSIASMYITSNGIGWGEIYASDPLLDLYNRYPQDVRNSFIEPFYNEKYPNQYTVRWAVPASDDFYSSRIKEVEWDSSKEKFYFTDNGVNIYVETETVNTYPVNYIVLNGKKHIARLSKKMMVRDNSFPKYFINKFSYQNGDAMLSSPVMIRWAEVILNRAEAYAHLGQDSKALDDINIIRKRAGLTGSELFGISNMHGYTKVLDVVLDERRMELAFEGHRSQDVYRNKLSLDRRFSGVQPWEIVKHDDNRIIYFIPSDEMNVSNIPQNP